MDIFTQSVIEKKGENYYLVTAETETKIYSERSLSREITAIQNKITLAQKTNSRLIWVAPYLTIIYKQLNPVFQKNLIWVAIPSEIISSNFKDEYKNTNIIRSLTDWNIFIRSVDTHDKFLIDYHTSTQLDEYKNFIQEGLRQIAVRLKTILHFSRQWNYNWKKNEKSWINHLDIGKISLTPPDAIVLGGPSVDTSYKALKEKKTIWCADTALYPLLKHNIIPHTVFTTDAGFGSMEHFVLLADSPILNSVNLVADPLSFSPILKMCFKNIYTYSSSNPLLKEKEKQHTIIENKRANVFGLIEAVFEKIFPDLPKPVVFGHDKRHIKFVTHLRGSGYFNRQFNRQTRFNLPGNYFYNLSKRYSEN